MTERFKLNWFKLFRWKYCWRDKSKTRNVWLTCSHDENKNVRLTYSKHICLNNMLVWRDWNVDWHVQNDMFVDMIVCQKHEMFERHAFMTRTRYVKLTCSEHDICWYVRSYIWSNISKMMRLQNNASRQTLRKFYLFFLYCNAIKLIIRWLQ